MVSLLCPRQYLSRSALSPSLQRLGPRVWPSKIQLVTGVGTQIHLTVYVGSSGSRKLHIRCLNTFLPYPDFERSIQCLDYRRLGKQRVEAWQILRIVQASPVLVPGTAWANAPAVRMWRGFPDALLVYYNACLAEWRRRGFKNVVLQPLEPQSPIIMPPWLGDELVHASHRSNLLRKEPEHYAQFGWTEQPNVPYVWPVPIVRSEVAEVLASDGTLFLRG